MKNIIKILMIASMVFVFTSCSSQENGISVSIQDLTNKLQKDIAFPEMANQNVDTFNQYYDVDVNLFEEFELWLAGNGVTADEMLIVKLKNSQDVDLLQQAVKSRQIYLKSEFEQYNPAEVQKIEDAVIFNKSNYFIFVISGDSKRANDILVQEFK